MNGHPALAYVAAMNMLEERRREARSHHRAKAVPKTRSWKVGSYRLTLTREVS